MNVYYITFYWNRGKDLTLEELKLKLSFKQVCQQISENFYCKVLTKMIWKNGAIPTFKTLKFACVYYMFKNTYSFTKKKYPVDFDDELKIGDIRYDNMT